MDGKKPKNLLKHLHFLWPKSGKNTATSHDDITSDSSVNNDLELHTQRPSQQLAQQRPQLQQASLHSEILASETDSSVSVCQSPISNLSLTRENSLSVYSPNGSESEQFRYLSGDSNRNNGNASQNTLLCENITPAAPILMRHGSIKRRDRISKSNDQRTKLRRTHSMFANTNEVKTVTPDIVPTYNSCLEESKIPIHYDDNSNDNLPRVSVETLVKIMDKEYKGFYGSIYIIDCRFEYEFLGGHIKDAVNISKQKQLEEEFIHKRHVRCKDTKKPPLIIFHCEFSSYRGPILASHLRTCDRILNHDNYPKLHFPDVVILDGGFKTFYEKYPNKCEGSYVCMQSKNHEEELSEFKRDSKKVMTRANSTQILLLKNNSLRNCAFQTNYYQNDVRNHPYRRENYTAYDNENNNDYEEQNISNFSISIPPKLSLDKYGELSPSHRSSSSKSSSLCSSSKLLFSNEAGTGLKPKFLENDESDFDSDAYSFQFGDDDDDVKLGSVSGKKQLLPDLVNADRH